MDGDKYEPGLVGLAAWAATLGAILLAGAFAIYTVRGAERGLARAGADAARRRALCKRFQGDGAWARK